MNASPEIQVEELLQGLEEVFSKEELLSKLKKSCLKKKPLTIKAGFDPSRPDIHLGHTVLLNKLKQFQDFGHNVVFLVGDFTALIGDPSGRDETRPILSLEVIKKNAKTYTDQAFKILDSKKTQILYNSKWFSSLQFQDLIELSSQYTVARMLERDDFKKRFKLNRSIGIHEFLYPLMQGYDSVAMKADVEIGGTDQTFNLLMGRHLQKFYKQSLQVVMTLPLLEGIDGVKKMSKSYDNYIALTDKPQDMLGKIMKLSDELMLRYYKLLTPFSKAEWEQLKKDIFSGVKHPKKVKLELGHFFVSRFYSKKVADQALEEFEKVFSSKGVPDSIPEFSVDKSTDILNLMLSCKMVPSKGEGRRLIQSGGVSLIEEDKKTKVESEKYNLFSHGEGVILKVGKRKFARLYFLN